MRFRLRTIFLVTFLVAFACMVLFALPDWLSVIALAGAATVTPGGIIAGIIYGRGAKRAFAIGCLASGGWLFWGAPMLFLMSINGESLTDETAMVKMMFAGFYLLLAVGGLVSIGVRRLCYQGRNGIRPPRDCC